MVSQGALSIAEFIRMARSQERKIYGSFTRVLLHCFRIFLTLDRICPFLIVRSNVPEPLLSSSMSRWTKFARLKPFIKGVQSSGTETISSNRGRIESLVSMTFETAKLTLCRIEYDVPPPFGEIPFSSLQTH
jgi:hypothetical protein